MSVLVVVVIVGVIAAIAVATLSDDRKTATPVPPPEREPVPESELPPVPLPPPGLLHPPDPAPVLDPAWADHPAEAFEPAFAAPEVEPVVVEPSPSMPDDRSWGRRLRSAGLLGLAVAILGATAAATIGGSVLIGYRFLDRALG